MDGNAWSRKMVLKYSSAADVSWSPPVAAPEMGLAACISHVLQKAA